MQCSTFYECDTRPNSGLELGLGLGLGFGLGLGSGFSLRWATNKLAEGNKRKSAQFCPRYVIGCQIKPMKLKAIPDLKLSGIVFNFLHFVIESKQYREKVEHCR